MHRPFDCCAFIPAAAKKFSAQFPGRNIGENTVLILRQPDFCFLHLPTLRIPSQEALARYCSSQEAQHRLESSAENFLSYRRIDSGNWRQFLAEYKRPGDIARRQSSVSPLQRRNMSLLFTLPLLADALLPQSLDLADRAGQPPRKAIKRRQPSEVTGPATKRNTTTSAEPAPRTPTWEPVADITNGEQAFTLVVELPGVSKDGIQLRLEGDQLVLSGERLHRKAASGDDVIITERVYGRFERRFLLPDGISGDAITANFLDGLLEVTVPKGKPPAPRTISIGTPAGNSGAITLSQSR
jgi:HSP20 family protein